jgi:hypothetical protein
MQQPSHARQAHHAMRAVLDLLPGLPEMDGALDLEAVDGSRIQHLASELDSLIELIHRAVAAIGHLLLHAARAVDDGEMNSQSLAGLGRLLAELGDLAVWATVVNAHCRHLNANGAAEGEG